MAANNMNGYANHAYEMTDGNMMVTTTPVLANALNRHSSPKRNKVTPTSSPVGHRLPNGVSNAGTGTSPSKDDQTNSTCGYCCWTPKCLINLATGRFFVLFCSLLSLTEAGLTIGYISSVVTSIEQNFNFSSTLTGFAISCYDIGTLLVVLTSYYGGRAGSNRPKWIAWSAWTMSLGACIVPISHFISGNYQTSRNTQDNLTDSLLCETPATASAARESSANVDEGDGSCSSLQEPVTAALAFLIPGMLLIGAGSTSMFTLGTTYIDDHVRKSESPILLAIFFCTTVIGPAIGFVVGFLVLGLYVDFNKDSSDNVSSSDPDWLGAWWLGFFICATTIAITAVPVYAYPARLLKPGQKAESDDVSKATTKESDQKPNDSESEEGRQVLMTFSQVSLKKIPRAIWSLLKNPIYMMINIASAVEFSIVTGFVRFSPKFIEYQFNLGASSANLVTGMLVPVGALGVVIGGIILNRVKRDLMTTINVLVIFTVTSGCLYAFVFIPGPCPTVPLAGVTKSYVFGDSAWQPPSSPYNVNLSSSCNALCRCRDWDYNPVCGSNAVTYYSPCHAGCTGQQDVSTDVEFDGQRKLKNYINCSCIDNFVPLDPGNSSPENSRNSLRREFQNLFRTGGVDIYHDGYKFTYNSQATEGAITGQCSVSCDKMIPFVGLLLVVVCVTSIVQMPALMTTLRSVKKEERPFALGLQFVIIRLLGYIPAPIYYGATIDSACKIWQSSCNGHRGACLEYDSEKYFYRYLGLSTGLKLISVTMAIFCWIFVRWKYGRQLMQEDGDVTYSDPDAEDQRTVGNLENSRMSLATQMSDVGDRNGSSNGIAVISNFKMTHGEATTREQTEMNSSVI